MERGAAASFFNCELANNTAVPSAGGAAVIVQDVWSAGDTATTAVGSNVRLEGCAPRVFDYLPNRGTVLTPNIRPLDPEIRSEQRTLPDPINMFKRPNIWCCYGIYIE